MKSNPVKHCFLWLSDVVQNFDFSNLIVGLSNMDSVSISNELQSSTENFTPEIIYQELDISSDISMTPLSINNDIELSPASNHSPIHFKGRAIDWSTPFQHPQDSPFVKLTDEENFYFSDDNQSDNNKSESNGYSGVHGNAENSKEEYSDVDDNEQEYQTDSFTEKKEYVTFKIDDYHVHSIGEEHIKSISAELIQIDESSSFVNEANFMSGTALDQDVTNDQKEPQPISTSEVTTKPDDWVEAVTEEGWTYFYNTMTEETCWTRPETDNLSHLSIVSLANDSIDNSKNSTEPVIQPVDELVQINIKTTNSNGDKEVVATSSSTQKLFVLPLNNEGRSALHISAISCMVEGIKLLLDMGIEVDQLDSSGFSSLHLLSELPASPEKQTSMQVLLSYGADASLATSSKEKRTALHSCALMGDWEALVLLLEWGCDASIEDAYGDTALHLASRKGHLKCMQTLILGAPPQSNSMSNNGVYTSTSSSMTENPLLGRNNDIIVPLNQDRMKSKQIPRSSISSSVNNTTVTTATSTAASTATEYQTAPITSDLRLHTSASDIDEFKVQSSSSQEWAEYLSPDGYKYYYNLSTHESQWEHPIISSIISSFHTDIQSIDTYDEDEISLPSLQQLYTSTSIANTSTSLSQYQNNLTSFDTIPTRQQYISPFTLDTSDCLSSRYNETFIYKTDTNVNSEYSRTLKKKGSMRTTVIGGLSSDSTSKPIPSLLYVSSHVSPENSHPSMSTSNGHWHYPSNNHSYIDTKSNQPSSPPSPLIATVSTHNSNTLPVPPILSASNGPSLKHPPPLPESPSVSSLSDSQSMSQSESQSSHERHMQVWGKFFENLANHPMNNDEASHRHRGRRSREKRRNGSTSKAKDPIRLIPTSITAPVTAGTEHGMSTKVYSKLLVTVLNTAIVPSTDLEQQNQLHNKVFLAACQYRDRIGIEQLLQYGVSVSVTDSNRRSPAHIVVNHDLHSKDAMSTALTLLALLLDYGEDLDSQDVYGWTPLMYACVHGSVELVGFILQSAADVNAKENAGNTALHLAAHEGHEAVINKLLEYDANPNILNTKGQNAHLVARLSDRNIESKTTILFILSQISDNQSISESLHDKVQMHSSHHKSPKSLTYSNKKKVLPLNVYNGQEEELIQDGGGITKTNRTEHNISPIISDDSLGSSDNSSASKTNFDPSNRRNSYNNGIIRPITASHVPLPLPSHSRSSHGYTQEILKKNKKNSTYQNSSHYENINKTSKISSNIFQTAQQASQTSNDERNNSQRKSPKFDPGLKLQIDTASLKLSRSLLLESDSEYSRPSMTSSIDSPKASEEEDLDENDSDDEDDMFPGLASAGVGGAVWGIATSLIGGAFALLGRGSSKPVTAEEVAEEDENVEWPIAPPTDSELRQKGLGFRETSKTSAFVPPSPRPSDLIAEDLKYQMRAYRASNASSPMSRGSPNPPRDVLQAVERSKVLDLDDGLKNPFLAGQFAKANLERDSSEGSLPGTAVNLVSRKYVDVLSDPSILEQLQKGKKKK